MNHRVVGFGRGFPRAWLAPIAALTILLGIAASGRLSRSIVADLIAWWPIWLAVAITAYLLRNHKVGAYRVSGLVPLAALALVLIFTWGHLAGWSIMPSASQRLVGPEVGALSSATLTAEIDGRIDVSGGSEFLYQVEPIKSGGGIPIPLARENFTDSSVTIDLQPKPEDGLYVYAGWDVSLSSDPVWALDIDGAIDADLTQLEVSELDVSGTGTLRLGTASFTTPVNVHGSFEIVIPETSPAHVAGVAKVPASWTLTSDGASGPGLGEGWLITVIGDASVTIVSG